MKYFHCFSNDQPQNCDFLPVLYLMMHYDYDRIKRTSFELFEWCWYFTSQYGSYKFVKKKKKKKNPLWHVFLQLQK